MRDLTKALALGCVLAATVSTAAAQSATDENGEPIFGSPYDDRFWVGVSGGFAFSDSSDYDNGPAAMLTFGKTLSENFGLQLEGQFEELTVSDVGNTNISSDYTRYGVGLSGMYIAKLGRAQLMPMVGLGFRRIEWLGEEEDGLSAYAGLGAAFKVARNLDITLDGRYLLDFSDGEGVLPETTYYTWNALVGLRFKLGTWPAKAPDGDQDGVPDYKDNCPNTPYGALVNERGCAIDSDADGVGDYGDSCPNTPPGTSVDGTGCPLDSDGDGVPDILDECPDTPPGVEVDARGCPLDTDQDGVVNARDLCPNTPFGAEVDVHGCPFDTDQDGVPDFRDACPNTPFGTPVNDRGCPLDSDGDGVPDSIDQCPNTFPGMEVNEVGCPIKNQVLVLNNVHFEFNRADLLPDSRGLLNKVAKSLLDQPGVKIEVAGHTDSVGSDAYNLRLSEARAASVRSYLVSQGVAAATIYAKGYGERQPVASNQNEDGRARNRRVEVHLLDN